jgi:hypothetical protein
MVNRYQTRDVPTQGDRYSSPFTLSDVTAEVIWDPDMLRTCARLIEVRTEPYSRRNTIRISEWAWAGPTVVTRDRT